MKKFLQKLKRFVIILVITIILLEIGSYLVLRFTTTPATTSQEQTTTSYTHIPLSIYKRETENGTIQTRKESVLPVKKNYDSRWAYPEFNVSVTTNAFGQRAETNYDKSEVDIAFFGDSFTFGHGVEVNERYSNIVADSLSTYKVSNFAYLSGFQPEHYEFFLRNNPDLQPKRLIVGMYIGNDLDADLTETIYDRETNSLALPMRLISEEGAIYNAPELYAFPINRLIGHSYFVKLLVKTINKTHYRAVLFENILPNAPNCVALETGKEDLSGNRAIVALREIDQIVRDRGGKLTVFLIPQNYFFSKANPHIHAELKDQIPQLIEGNNLYKATKQQLDALGIDYFDPMDVLDETSYFDEDAHWNATGHQQAGSALAAYLKKNM